jgi:hypothetical protein
MQSYVVELSPPFKEITRVKTYNQYWLIRMLKFITENQESNLSLILLEEMVTGTPL